MTERSPTIQGRLRSTRGTAPAYNDRGTAYEAKGNNGQAVADFTKAIRNPPRAAEVYKNRGNVFQA